MQITENTQDLDRDIDGYRLLKLLGRGDGSEIYLAQREGQQLPVAVKILPGQRAGDDLARFYVHAARIKRLQHSHIVSVRDYGTRDHFTYLVMDYMPNGNLRERHARGSLIPPATIIRYTQQLAQALSYLHQQQLIHRDLKPQNMLLNARNEVVLSDFGISVVSHSLDPIAPIQHDFEGTVIYCAPEQLLGRPRRASDQYALGVVVYEWLCGARPFTGAFDEMVEQHLHHMPPPLRSQNPSLSPLIEQVVMKSLAKSPEKRFPSVDDFAQALTWAIEQDLPEALPPPPETPRPELLRQFKRPGLF